ncbi:MAG: hypothetical protein AB1384_12445 [Actinomycetota bacterium]
MAEKQLPEPVTTEQLYLAAIYETLQKVGVTLEQVAKNMQAFAKAKAPAKGGKK